MSDKYAPLPPQKKTRFSSGKNLLFQVLEEADHGALVGILRLREASLVDAVAHLVVHPPVHLLGKRLLLAGLRLEVQPRVAHAFDVIERRVKDLDDL